MKNKTQNTIQQYQHSHQQYNITLHYTFISLLNYVLAMYFKTFWLFIKYLIIIIIKKKKKQQKQKTTQDNNILLLQMLVL